MLQLFFRASTYETAYIENRIKSTFFGRKKTKKRLPIEKIML